MRDVERFRELARRSQRDHVTVIHDRHAIAKALRLLHVVRRKDDRPAFRLEYRDQVPKLTTRLWIETGRRLVQEEKLRIPDKRARDRQPLLLATRQSSNARMALFAQLYLIDDFSDIARIAIEALEERERLIDRELLRQLGVLELDPEQLAQIPRVRLPAAAEYLD